MVEINVLEHGKVLIFAVVGDFCFESIKYSEETWNQCLTKNPEVVAIDCGGITFIDSAAIGTLVKFYNKTSEAGIPLIFYGLGKRLIEVFRIARLDSLFNIMSKKDFEVKYLTEKTQ